MAGIDYTKERLRISGEILYGLNHSPYNPMNSKRTPEYYLKFGADYKITDNFSIGFQIINQNTNPYSYSDPFGYRMYNPYNPFNGY